MLTLRERAAAAYGAARAQGRGNILGVESMVTVVEDRLTTVRRAQQVINAASGTERISLREPDNAELDRILQQLQQLEGQLEADRLRWARGGR